MKKEVNMRPIPPERKRGDIKSFGVGMSPDGRIITDPNGSYTGVSLDGEEPIQDVDDL